MYYDLLHSDHNYDMDCDFIESLFERLQLEPPASILDIGCGTGEHSIRLLEKGHRVVGIDVSQHMLEKARSKVAERNLSGQFYLQDMRGIELGDEFDCAICLFGAFARLFNERDFTQFLQGLHRHLRDGGLFIFDFINREGVISRHRDWKIIQKEGLTLIRLDSSELGGCVLDEYHQVFVLNGKRLVDHIVENHKLQTHTLSEVEELLRKRGFQLVHPADIRASRTQSFGMRVAALKKESSRVGS